MSKALLDTPQLPHWQQAPWQQFAARRLGAAMPHALMFTAHPGLGLNEFAARARASLLCNQPESSGVACGQCRSCMSLLSGTHPDFYEVTPEDGKVSIGVDAIREMAEKLSKTPQAGGFQVALIHPAHGMTVAAANALLKTLEEPARQTVLLLVSEQPGKLLPTILSRCQRLHLPRPSTDIARQWLEHIAPEQTRDVALALEIAGGAPVLALQLLQDQSVQQFSALAKALDRAVAGETIDALAIGKQWSTKLPDFARLYEFYLLAKQRDVARKNQGAASQNASQRLTAAQKILSLGRQFQELMRIRDWTGSGIRIDLAIAQLLETHVKALS
jgi:DNA polymerase III subunit delta'